MLKGREERGVLMTSVAEERLHVYMRYTYSEGNMSFPHTATRDQSTQKGLDNDDVDGF